MKTEDQINAWVILNAMKQHGSLLLRNNSGVLRNGQGIPIRFGLGNTSSQINRVFKSSDQIGITPVQCPCGKRYGVFTAIEMKKPGWKYRNSDQTALGQLNFINRIREKSGIAGFIQNEEDFYNVYR